MVHSTGCRLGRTVALITHALVASSIVFRVEEIEILTMVPAFKQVSFWCNTLVFKELYYTFRIDQRK